MEKKSGKARLRAVIFDLDGTLLNTLDDLTYSTNAALRDFDMPERTLGEVRAFVGNGVRRLIERAVPPGTPEETVRAVYSAFVRHNDVHKCDRTQPYPGVMALLDALAERGIMAAVVSNKIEPAVVSLCDTFFGGRLACALGDTPDRARKPAPDSTVEAMARMGVSAEACLYVGDSDVDVMTAHNALLPCAGVTWGFRDEALLRAAGAEYICHTAQELLQVIAGLAEGCGDEE